jgi:hypothetical protein
MQIVVVHVVVKKPFCSKDTILAAFGLGPALILYRAVRGKKSDYDGTREPAFNHKAFLKLTEVVFESVPCVVIQERLLAMTPISEWSGLQVFSLLTSLLVTACVVVHLEA